jgi:peptidoglycan/xylan/chitin deacetylase (PgdA/CDA1 family)
VRGVSGWPDRRCGVMFGESPWPRILMYHSVGRVPNDTNGLCTSPERFEAHMEYLKRHNLCGVSMRELHRAVKAGSAEGLIGLTFDDGYRDFLRSAVPILESFGFSATVFVIGDLLGGENDWEHHMGPQPRMKLLEAAEVREVAERGMEVGAHSMTHVRLSGLDPERLEEEVAGSRRVLSEVVGEEVEGFCYPFGNLDGAAVRAVRRAGYTYACAVHRRVEKSVYDLPRIIVSEKDHLLRLKTKLRVYCYYTKVKNLYSRPI